MVGDRRLDGARCTPLDALGLYRVHLVVDDIGGPTGFDVVARAPDRIASPTVVNTMVRVASFDIVNE